MDRSSNELHVSTWLSWELKKKSADLSTILETLCSRGKLPEIWLTTEKNAVVSQDLNFKVHMLLKVAVIKSTHV